MSPIVPKGLCPRPPDRSAWFVGKRKKHPHPALSGHLLPQAGEGQHALLAIHCSLQNACRPSPAGGEGVATATDEGTLPTQIRSSLGRSGPGPCPGALGDRTSPKRAPHGCRSWRPPGKGPAPDAARKNQESMRNHPKGTVSNTSPYCACKSHKSPSVRPLTGSTNPGAISANGFNTKACFSSGRGTRRCPGPSTMQSP